MNTITKRSPWRDLFSLLLITLVVVLLLSLLLVVVGSLAFGGTAILGALPSEEISTWYFYYFMLALSSVGTFLLPAVIFRKRIKAGDMFPQEVTRDWKPYLLGILFLFGISPCMSLISDWNMHMTLPKALEGIEQWMRAKEDEADAVMQVLVMTDRWDRLLMNVLLLGVLPGIGEEFFFRGALQHIAKRIFNNEQTAIWVVALIFSAVHLQFYGFFPRLLLGVFLGYMVVWSRNIWTSVLAHFINNTMVVLLAFYYTRQGKSFVELMESDSYAIIVYIGSLVSGLFIAFLYYRYTNRKK